MNFEKLWGYWLYQKRNCSLFQYHLNFVHVFLILYLLRYERALDSETTAI